MGRTPGKRWHWSCLWSALSAILALILAHLPFLHSIELKTLDARFRQFPDPGLARGDIVLIVVDEESVQQLQSILGRWPWPRDAYGLLLDFLRAGGARIVAFDILFAEPHLERPEGDRAFAEAIAKAGNVYLAAAFHDREIGHASTARPAEALTLQGITPPLAIRCSRLPRLTVRASR